MMFEIAAIESAAKRNGWETCYPNAFNYFHYIDTETAHNAAFKNAHEYKHIFKNFDWKPELTKHIKNGRSLPFGTNAKGFTWEDDTVYDGFFQSEKWFYARDFIFHLFEFSDYVTDQISPEFREHDFPGEDSCFIHVRRGWDRINMSRVAAIHPITTIEYLERAIDMMGEKKYYIFSDDIEWCYDNVPTGTGTIYSTHKDYVDLYLMSQCRSAIIGPSTFSWWGAWLGNMERVIAPEPWVLDKKIDTSQVIPETWERVAL